MESGYRCSLELKVAHNGWMYITTTQLLFDCSFPKTKLQIALSSISSMEKKKTAKVIPNAIKFTLKDGKKVTNLDLFGFALASNSNNPHANFLLAQIVSLQWILQERSCISDVGESDKDCQRVGTQEAGRSHVTYCTSRRICHQELQHHQQDCCGRTLRVFAR